MMSYTMVKMCCALDSTFGTLGRREGEGDAAEDGDEQLDGSVGDARPDDEGETFLDFHVSLTACVPPQGRSVAHPAEATQGMRNGMPTPP